MYGIEKIKLKIVGFGGDELIESKLGYDNYLYGFNVKNHRWTGYQIIDGKFVAYEIQETEIATRNRERSVTSVELKFEHISTGVLRVYLMVRLITWMIGNAVSDLAQFSFGQGHANRTCDLGRKPALRPTIQARASCCLLQRYLSLTIPFWQRKQLKMSKGMVL